MSFSYTEKKRVRRSFEKISSVMELPNLLATQVQSYDAFLQRYVDSDKRLNAGLEQVLNSIFPIESHNGFARMEYSGFTLGEPIFDERECKLKGITYEISLHINCDLFFIDKDSGKLKEGKSQSVYMGTVPLMTDHGTFIIMAQKGLWFLSFIDLLVYFLIMTKAKAILQEKFCTAQELFLTEARG